MATGTENKASGSEDIVEITIVGKDNMRFDIEEFKVKPGQKVRLTLIVNSKIPAMAMSHNVAIVDLGTDVDKFAQKSMLAKDNEYIASEYEDAVIANTAMIGGDSEPTTVEFTAPETSGEYVYLCTFPGHFMAGMKGVMIVE